MLGIYSKLNENTTDKIQSIFSKFKMLDFQEVKQSEDEVSESQ